MTEEEYRQQQAERQALLNQYNNLVGVYNNLVDELNEARAELSTAIDNIAVVNNNAIASAKIVLPQLDVVIAKTGEVSDATHQIYMAILALRDKYIKIKNVSTSSKKLTELDDIYERKYRFYEKLRKIALGYVIGIDSTIISSETLRVEVEKQQLKNSEYWLSYALSSIMLWVSDEKEASDRALNKALSMEEYKGALFFMLVNLRFGRVDAAKKWYEVFSQDVDIFDIRPEWEFILQAYLHHAFGRDDVFEKKVKGQLVEMLGEMKKSVPGYERKISGLVQQFAEAYPHSTNKEYTPIYENVKDYKNMISVLTSAEKNAELTKYYLDVYETDDTSAGTLKENIENVLYDLASEQEPGEFEITKQIKYNEFVVKANGDLSLAKQMYDLQFKNDSKKTSLDQLMFRFAFADSSDVDNRLQKFAISFLIEQIKKGYENYKEAYNGRRVEKYHYSIDGIEFEGTPETESDSRALIQKYYKKNKNKLIYRDKGVKALTATALCSIFALIITIVVAICTKSFGIGILISFLVFLFASIGLVLGWIFRAKKKSAKIKKQEEETLKTLHATNESIKEYARDLDEADQQSAGLMQVLEKYEMEV